MTSDRKKPGMAFWATVGLVVVLVGYPLSFGPVCWLVARNALPVRPTAKAYRPLIDFCYGYFPCDFLTELQLPLSDAMYWYGRTTGGKLAIDEMYCEIK